MNWQQKFLAIFNYFWQRVIRLQEWALKRKWIRICINLLLILLLLLLVGRSLVGDFQQVKDEFLLLDWSNVLAAIGYLFLNTFILVYAWHLILSQFGSTVSLSKNLEYFAYGQLAKLLPTPAWFFASRLKFYTTNGLSKRIILLTTAIETLLHVVTGIAFYCFSSFKIEKPVTYLYFLGFLPLFLLIWKNNWLTSRWLLKDHDTEPIARRTIVTWLLLFFMTWVTAGPFFTNIVSSFSPPAPLPIIESWRIWTFSSILAYIGSYTLGGIAVLREFSITLLLSKYYSSSLALLITVFSRILITIGSLIWSFLVIMILKGYGILTRKKIHHPVNGEE